MYEGSYGSEFLLKTRSQSLEVNTRTYRWSVDGVRECNVCGIGAEENMNHLIVECSGYVCKRDVFMRHVSETIGEDFMTNWSADNEHGMCVLLGSYNCW